MQVFVQHTLEICMKNAISWFEIPTLNLDAAQTFYEALLARPMRREAMGPSEGAVFAYDIEADGTGGALMMGPTAPPVASGGTLVYLDASPSLDAALERAQAAGGQVALPRTALPEGMGFFAHIRDLDGNRVGLHALQ
jgi:hypothetical protein